MDAFHRLSVLSSNVKERAAPVWKSGVLQFERGLQWLKLRPQAVFFAAGMSIALLLLIFSGVTAAVAAVAAWIALMRHFAQTEADRQRRIARMGLLPQAKQGPPLHGFSSALGRPVLPGRETISRPRSIPELGSFSFIAAKSMS